MDPLIKSQSAAASLVRPAALSCAPGVPPPAPSCAPGVPPLVGVRPPPRLGRWWGQVRPLVGGLAAGRWPLPQRSPHVGGDRSGDRLRSGSDFRKRFQRLTRTAWRRVPPPKPRWWGFGRRFARAGVGIRPPLRQGRGGDSAASHAPLWPQEARWIASGRGELGWMRPMVDALLWPQEARWRGVRPPPWSVGGLRPAAAASPWAALAESTHGNPLIRKAFPAASCEPGCCTLSH